MDKSIKKQKIKALASYLNLSISKIEATQDRFEAEGIEYLVLTDHEANKAVLDYIEDSLWAFKYSFLQIHSKAIAAIPEKEFTTMQSNVCEGLNKAIKAMIDDYSHFVKDAVLSDGRGHFLSFYDGEEVEQDEFYIYRT